MADLQTSTTISKRKRSRERGQALVEFAMASLVFFLLVFGIFDMVRLFESWIAVQHAAREGARYAITGQTTCEDFSTRNACIVESAKEATTGLSGGGQTGGDVTVTYKSADYSKDGTTGLITWAGDVANSSGNACDQIEVKVEYTHHFVTPLLQPFAPGGISLSGTQRMTNEPYGPCS